MLFGNFVGISFGLGGAGRGVTYDERVMDLWSVLEGVDLFYLCFCGCRQICIFCIFADLIEI